MNNCLVETSEIAKPRLMKPRQLYRTLFEVSVAARIAAASNSSTCGFVARIIFSAALAAADS